ncbi:sensor protein [Halosimplex carlsbadense 2-9-1]|uniref:Sensor protein n=1 Tax=Halosimplex carlsbadense 2-9-1 TaxID=797114 RepID=M0CED2_9EURY|nr:DICT sensory domain-containing protein [Halosimplex carlsbadense]ELZ20244.1 sensor protein [Halosimplex carlsbadense 2-9-1]
MAAEDEPPLRELRGRARGPSKTVTTFGPEPYDDLTGVLDRFDAELVHESLPIPESSGYLVVKRGGEYLGAISAAAFGELRDPPDDAPWDTTAAASAYHDLVALLSGTSFEMGDRDQMVATAREIEDRAWRNGRGRLYATFQALSAFEKQVSTYEHLAGTTDLSVTVYGDPDWGPPDIDGVDIRRDETGEISDFWVVAFDGGGDDADKCAMIAEEESPGTYVGVVTYDPGVVDDLTAYLDDVAGSTP